MPDDQTKGLLAAFLGIITLSPDTLLVRLLDMPQWTLQFYREAGTAAVLFTFFFAINGKKAPAKLKAVGWTGLLAGLFFAVSSVLFVSALYLTSVANVLAIISCAPIWGAILTRIFLKERLPMRTWIAAFAGAACIAVIFSGGVGGGGVLGDLMALLQSILMAGAFVLVRSRTNVDMVPCRALGAVIVAAAVPFLSPELAVPASDLPLLALLSLVVLPASYALLITATRHLPAPEVNMIMLLEMVLGPLLVWALVGEAAPPLTLAGGSALFLVLLAHSYMGLRARTLTTPRAGR